MAKLTGDWEFLQDKAAFDDWLKPLESVTWVAYIEPPPCENCPPEQMAKYLARYLTGGPISDRRIVSHENGFVTFLARVGKRTGVDDEVEPIRLHGAEFVRRWCLHSLPKGDTKTRRFGGYWNGQREFVGHLRAAHGILIRAIRDLTSHAKCSSRSIRQRTTIASASTGIITPAKSR